MRVRSKTLRAGFFAAAALLALSAGHAYAQSDSKVVVDPDDLPQNKALDRQYREMLNRVPDGKDANDPWGTVRGAEAPTTKKDKKKSAAEVK